MSGRRGRAAVAVTLLTGTAAAACDVLFTEPAPSSFELPISFSLAVDSASGPAKAFSRVDRVYLRFARSDTAHRDTLMRVAHEDGGIRVRIALESQERIDSLGVYAELRTAEAALFKGGRAVRIESGVPTVAEVPLLPIPALLRASHDALTLEAVGDTVRLSSAVLFASEDTIPELAGAWSSKNPEIVAVSPSGLALARAVGETLLVVHFGELLEAAVEARVLGPG